MRRYQLARVTVSGFNGRMHATHPDGQNVSTRATAHMGTHRAWCCVLLALCLVLGGCSAWRLVYRQGPSLTYWWLDRYVDLNGAQTAMVRSTLDRWFVWQRQQLMGEIRPVLLEVQDQVRDGPKAAQVCAWWHRAERWRDAAFEQVLPDLAALALTLTPAQWANIEARHVKTNEEFEDDFLQPDPKRRAEASFKRLRDNVEILYGDLREPQLQALRQGLAASPFDPQRWQTERLRRQADLMHTLRSLKGLSGAGAGGGGAGGGGGGLITAPEQAQAALRAWWTRVQSSPDPQTQQYQSALVAYNCQFAADFHQIIDEGQRQHATQRLRDWAADVEALTLPSLTGR